MNKEYRELINKKRILNNEIWKLDRYLSPIRSFVNKRGQYFKNEDSIKALSIIQEDLNKMELVLDEKKIEREKISRTLIENCNHSIVINNVCPICGEYFYEVPKSVQISLEIPAISENELMHSLFNDYIRRYNNECLNKIIEIVKSAIQEEDTLLYFEEAFEELQYDKNIKIKRFKR